MDSIGHNAQYCTYTFMENSTKQILCVITMDKRMTDRKSTNLEKACFVKGLQAYTSFQHLTKYYEYVKLNEYFTNRTGKGEQTPTALD